MLAYRYIILIVFISAFACKQNPTTTYQKISGLTMGTSYQITCPTDDTKTLQIEIEALLKEINDGMNHYLPNSLITQFNNSEKGETYNLNEIEAQHFYENIAASRRVVKETNNHFDPTVGPLVNYWKFGPDGKYNLTSIDSTQVDSLMEVGGETRVAGVNNKGIPWVLGINTPKEDAGIKELSKVISITEKAIATSGNYRNLYEVEGVKVSHTINPFTGYPERTNLLSVTIIHDECMYADAYATACMVMGLDKALQFVNTHPELSYLFLFSKEDGELASVDSGDITFLE
jgi:thiamine biosynthesis lipoprotein